MDPPSPSTPPARGGDGYHGFTLRSVCWGYREIFARAIDGLLRQGLIGPERQEVTRRFFELMKQADQRCFDHVLKEFLAALNPRMRWLLDLPGVFVDIVDLGQELANARLHYGITLFRTLGTGGLGERPDQVRDLVTHARRLRETDDDLAVAFIKGYRRLIDRLRPEEIGLYIDAGLEIFRRSKPKALAFLEGRLKTSETYILRITRECRLDDVHPIMSALLKALTGREIEVCELGRLDSDDLIERGCSLVCLYKWLYVPSRIRYFDDAATNRKWYLLASVVAAGMIAEDSFCRVHGLQGHRTCREVVGSDSLRLNLFQIAEYVRVLRRVRARWPGSRRLIDFALREEFRWRPPASAAERLFHDAARSDAAQAPGVAALLRLADGSVNFFDTVRQLDGELAEQVARDCPGLAGDLLRPFAFLPDFLFPGGVSAAPRGSLVADLKRAAEQHHRRRDEGAGEDAAAQIADEAREGSGEQEEADRAEAARVCYVYDEWSHEEGDYYRDYCFVYEKVPEQAGEQPIPPDITSEARRVGRVFERLKPDLTRREKYLQEGEQINADLLVDYLVQRRKEPSPKVRFYEKPRINRRDLAVEIVLDASGSTAEELSDRKRIIEIEKHAALILGQGLASLGDRFSICGFHSNGPENCAFFVYKDFDEAWGRDSIGRVLSAYPLNCTRIGPALRHAGFRLGRVDARQRLIILITDGRPMDDRYDPNTRHAQYDVRMACEENDRKTIHTFGISTEENSLPDMEIMFPRRRFVILPDIRQLPRVLPSLYVRLTV